MRLQQKALFVTLPLILIPTIILGWLSFHYTKDAQVQIENAKLQADVTYRVNGMKNYINNARSALQFIANNGDIKMLQSRIVNNLSYSLAREFILESFETFASAYPDTEAIVLFTNEEQPILSYSDPDKDIDTSIIRVTQSLADWRLISDQNRPPKIEIQLPLIIDDPDSAETGEKKYWGHIKLILAPKWLTLFDLPEDEGIASFIVSDLDGRLLFTYPYNNVGTILPKLLFNRLLDSAKSSQASDVNDGSQKVYFAGKTIEQRYLLLYGMNESNVRHHESSITFLTVLVVLMSVVFAPMLLFYVFSRHVIQPIEKLANAKQQVAQGMLDVKLDIPNNDELGELFAAFNVMVRQLVVYRENERESRLRLEYKVQERTEELEQTNFALANSNRDLELAKQLSEQANELKSAFVANISHEIRTPLTAILGFTEQVIADLPSSKYQLDLLERVLKSGKHLLALINDILDLSKIESDKMDLEITQVDLFELFNDVMTLLSSQASAKGLKFEFNQSFPLPRFVRTDATRLRQILLNLAGNAIKFTEQGYIHIHVYMAEDKQSVAVSVKDTGIGMSEAIQKRIFTPFVQADVSISRRFGGTGLGLVISKKLANLLGGDIQVHSEEGQGSEFIVDFAITADNVQFDVEMLNHQKELQDNAIGVVAAEKDITPEPFVGEPMTGRVLVAEDVEDNQYLFGLLLRAAKVDYVMVENGEQAFEKALAEDFDLILMDMQMPVMSGVEATELLRQAGVDTPIYALTANVMAEDIERHLEVGCNGTIAKPIEKKELYKVLQRYLTAKHQAPTFEIPNFEMDSLRVKYVDQLAIQNGLIQSLVATQDVTELKAECHKVKGTAGSYGFKDLGECAGECEALLDNQLKQHLATEQYDWPSIVTCIDKLTDQITDIVQSTKASN